jgi:hypothetical protein
MTRLLTALIVTTGVLLSGCGTKPAPVVAAAPVPVPVPQAVPMPSGAYVGMPVPPTLPGGAYATPNVNLSSAGAVWHLRAGLNFAALGCRGPEEAGIIARYNAMLSAQKPVLANAERTLIAEYRATAPTQWRDAYDDAMTRLYNYYALAPARAALCVTADRLLTEAQTVTPDAFPAFAAQRLPELDRAYTDFYRAYDAWRAQGLQPLRPALPQATYAIAASAPMAPTVQAAPAPRPVQVAQVEQRPTPATRGPWIEVDPAVLRLP